MKSLNNIDEYIAVLSMLDVISQFPTDSSPPEWIAEKRAYAIKQINKIQKENNERNLEEV